LRDRCVRVLLPWLRPPRLKAQVVDLPVKMKVDLLILEVKNHRRMLQLDRHFLIELSVSSVLLLCHVGHVVRNANADAKCTWRGQSLR